MIWRGSKKARAEEALRDSQAQLAGIVNSAMDAIITVDEEQRLVLFNAAGEKMFLYPAALHKKSKISRDVDALLSASPRYWG